MSGPLCISSCNGDEGSGSGGDCDVKEATV